MKGILDFFWGGGGQILISLISDIINGFCISELNGWWFETHLFQGVRVLRPPPPLQKKNNGQYFRIFEKKNFFIVCSSKFLVGRPSFHLPQLSRTFIGQCKKTKCLHMFISRSRWPYFTLIIIHNSFYLGPQAGFKV